MTRFELMLTVSIVITILSAVTLTVYAIDSAMCSSISSEMKVEGKYKLLTGCMIMVNGQMIPLGNFRVQDGRP